ncbi:STAS domain-containing protein [Longispora albida]|uniref:STAS domain-containing protein n=1 Tax=Longispora albida TaxID=203523 RepID=UPI00035C273A|nr:STAS domain-containing protein [Longispora albida]
MGFACEAQLLEAGCQYLWLSGEFDGQAAYLVTELINQGMAGGQVRVVDVDMSRLSALTAEGLGVLTGQSRICAARGVRMRIVHPASVIATALRRFGTADIPVRYGMPPPMVTVTTPLL